MDDSKIKSYSVARIIIAVATAFVMAMVAYSLSLGGIPIVSLCFFMVACMYIFQLKAAIKEDVPDEMKKFKTITITIMILSIIIGLVISVIIIINPNKNGFKKGDYSDEFTCVDCGKPADGGYWNTEAVGNQYFCKEHFELNRKEFEEYLKSDNNSNGDEDRDEFGNEDFNAFFDATYEVKKKLKSPSTAKFCESYEAEINRNGNTWSVEGWVDAQNSFGATLRNEFSVEITYTGENTYNVGYCIIE